MVNSEIKHNHRFEVKGNIEKCPCGEEREHSGEGRFARIKVVHQGDPNYKDPPASIPFKLGEKLGDSSAAEEKKQPPVEDNKTGGSGPWNRHKVLEENRKKITEDWDDMCKVYGGVKKFLEKWQLSASGWRKVMKRWKLTNQIDRPGIVPAVPLFPISSEVIHLKSGGFVRLEFSVNILGISSEMRLWLMGLVDHFKKGHEFRAKENQK